MNVNINGETVALPHDMTVSDALRLQGFDTTRVVVELNRIIVLSEHFDSTQLTENDVLEVLHFVGGG